MMNDFPRFFPIHQQFNEDRIDDVAHEVQRAIASTAAAQLHRVRPGQQVAIAVGSRGISQINTLVNAVVAWVKERSAIPFIVPAMGSHGGATAEGQAMVLAEYGITAEQMGCEIRSRMDAFQIGTTSAGVHVFTDTHAKQADHVILMNRIKPHTRIVGPYESGLVKMMLIGLGKHRGASEYHRAMTRQAFDEIVVEAVPIVMAHVPVLFGIAIVENAFDEVAQIEAIDAEHILDREPELLAVARRQMPRLLFEQADLVMIDRIGKNISGAGLDTNVVGRKANDKAAGADEWPKISQIYVRGLTPETKGNASGIGIAEYCRTRVVREMNVEVTRINCLTALHVTAAAIPVHWETDQEVLRVALGQSGRSLAEVRCLWIPDTLHLRNVMCSEAYYAQACTRADMQVLAEPAPLRWMDDGNLVEAFAAMSLPKA